MIEAMAPHFEAFQNSFSVELRPDDPGGKPWDKFCIGLRGVNNASLAPAIPPKIGRDEVFRIAGNPDVGTADVAAAALAWGGMNMAYHKAFFEAASNGWLSVAEAIRAGEVNRADAYEAFRILRGQGKMPGVGPAYYTKLIYFLGRAKASADNPQGYIVDQWTGCSMNLLLKAPVIHLNVSMFPDRTGTSPRYDFRVSDANSAQMYEQFCCAFEELVSLTGHSIDEVDHALQRQGSWREHVRQHRKP